jgi:histone H2A
MSDVSGKGEGKGKGKAKGKGKGKDMKPKKPGISSATRAELQFNPARCRRNMRKLGSSLRLGGTSSVYMAAVLEYLAAEVLELAGNKARDNKRSRITPRHMLLAIRNDEELRQVCQHATLASGGNMPNIHSVLLKTPKKKEAGGGTNGPKKAKKKKVPVEPPVAPTKTSSGRKTTPVANPLLPEDLSDSDGNDSDYVGDEGDEGDEGSGKSEGSDNGEEDEK